MITDETRKPVASTVPGPVEPSPAANAGRLRMPAAVKVVLALAAMAAALMGQKLADDARIAMEAAPPLLSWLLFGVAAVLFVAASLPVPKLLTAPSATFRELGAGMRKRRLFSALLLSSIVCGLASIPLFLTLNSDLEAAPQNWLANTGSWLLFIASLLLFGAAFVVWERATPAVEHPASEPPGDRLPPVLEAAIVTGLFAVALMFRVPNLDSMPPGLWFDEAQNGIVAQSLMQPDAAHRVFIEADTQMGALYFYLLGIVLELFGSLVWPLRLLPALAGSLIVPVLYLLAARLFGWRAGLAAAGLLAVSAWHITFSRFGMVTMTTVALNVGVYLCLVQGLRTGRLGYYAGSGVLLGLSLHTYYAARLVPFLLLVLFVHRLIMERGRFIKSVGAGAAVLVLGALLASAPMDIYAIQSWETFSRRVNDVSFVSEGGDPGTVLAQNFNEHMLMFNFKGDVNGRHNLPNAPMLDWLTAALFLAGLGTCLLRAWRWQYFFPLLWFAAALSGGVLTLPSEAPQAHRTLENSVVTALVAGMLLGEFWQLLSGLLPFRAGRGATTQTAMQATRKDATPPRKSPAAAPVVATVPVRARKPSLPDEPPPAAPRPAGLRYLLPAALSMAGILAVIGWASTANAQRYFGQQMQNQTVWQEMYVPQSEAARTLSRYGGSHDIYMSPEYRELPPSLYLAPGLTTEIWPGLHALPFKGGRGRDIVLILDRISASDLDYIKRMYPNTAIEPLLTPGSPRPIMYRLLITSSDVDALYGVRAALTRPGEQPEDKTLNALEYDWAAQGGGPGTLRLSATVRAETFGQARFVLQSASEGSGSVTVDGYAVRPDEPLTLAAGLHSVVVTDTVGSATGTTRLLWTPPGGEGAPGPVAGADLYDPRKVEPRGLTGYFRSGGGFEATPEAARIDPVVSFYFHLTPLPRPYTAEWVGKIYIPEAGAYAFSTEQISTSNLSIGGAQVVDNPTDNNLVESRVYLQRGLHDLRLRYQDLANYSHVHLYWTPPGKERSVVPSAFLLPEMGAYPENPESGDWPTLAQSDGTEVGGWTALPVPEVSAPPPARQPDAPTSQPQEPQQPQPQQTQQPPAASSAAQVLEPALALGSASEPLVQPLAASGDGEGNIYVLSDDGGSVQRFDADGQPAGKWTVTAGGAPVTEGSALVVKDGTVMILNAETAEVMSFSGDGKLLGSTRVCECYFPRGMSLAADGNYWIADTGNGRVLKVTPGGEVLSTVGSRGSEPGTFIEPASVWEAQDGSLYVADIGNGRVQRFGADLKFLGEWPVGESIARQGNRLTGMSEGKVLVTQTADRAIVEYGPSGEPGRRWTHIDGQKTLTPGGIAALGGDRFVVLFREDNRAVVFDVSK